MPPHADMKVPYSILLLLLLIRIPFQAFHLVAKSQFDPDEYWQTLEPAYCIIFAEVDSNSYLPGTTPNCAYTWEWTRRSSSISLQPSKNTISKLFLDALHGPVRSHVSLLPTLLIYSLCKFLRWDSRNVIALYGPYFIHGLMIVIPTDLAIWSMATLSGPTTASTCTVAIQYWALLAAITNWFLAYTLTRTYSNSIECMLTTVGACFILSTLYNHVKVGVVSEEKLNTNVCDCDGTDDECTYKTHIRIERWGLIKIACGFFFGGLSISVRFSSIAAWIPLGLITCIRLSTMILSDQGDISHTPPFSAHIPSTRKWLTLVLSGVFCIGFGLTGILISLLIDRYFYGFWAVPFLGNFHFNVILGLGSLYGSHPSYWYFLVGLPCICGFLLPFFLYEIYVIFMRHCSVKKHPQRHYISPFEDPYLILLVIIIFYLILHSFSTHKEFRFILPIMPMVCVLAGHAMSDLELNATFRSNVVPSSNRISFFRRRLIFSLSLILNYPILFYLCQFHQRASIQVNQYIADYIHDRLDISLASASILPEIVTDPTISVHYLLGCHSTPLYSHLHTRPFNASRQVIIRAWTLDCSPDCRRLKHSCESDLFLRHPLEFFNMAYGASDYSDIFSSFATDEYVDRTCSISNISSYIQHDGLMKPFYNPFPEVIVVDGTTIDSIGNILVSQGFREKVFRQSVKSIQMNCWKFSVYYETFHVFTRI